MRREYAGAARKARLAAPLGGSAVDLGILGDDLSGWPTGAGGPFFVVIGRGTPSEEKILCESRTGNSLTVYTDGVINGRGADGTTIVSHDFNDYLEHVHTATDADEANEHVNSTANVHGVTSDLVGENDTQTLTNKTIDGNANTLTNIPQAAVTGLTADLADLDATKANLAGGATFTGNIVLPSTTSIGNVSSTEIGHVDGVTSGIQAQLDSKAPINNPTFTGAVSLPATTSIGNVTGSEIAALDGVVGNVQSQLNALASGGGLDGGAVPPGGTTGQVLVKNSDDDFDVSWQTISSGGGGVDVIATAPYPTGGTVTTYTDGGTGYEYRVHTFDYTGAVDSFVVTNGVIGNLLLVGAGGSGGQNASRTGGGGGAGAVYSQTYAFGSGTHNLYVGRGGTGLSSSYGVNGEDTLWEGYPGTITGTTYIARGGGGGSYGRNSLPAFAGNSGGYGGGGGAQIGPGGTGTYGSIDGGATTNTTLFLGGNGGSTGSGSSVGGDGGGPGYTTSISGSSVTYSVGGPGATSTPGSTPGSGGGCNGAAGADGQIVIRYRIA